MLERSPCASSLPPLPFGVATCSGAVLDQACDLLLPESEGWKGRSGRLNPALPAAHGCSAAPNMRPHIPGTGCSAPRRSALTELIESLSKEDSQTERPPLGLSDAPMLPTDFQHSWKERNTASHGKCSVWVSVSRLGSVVFESPGAY